MSGEYVCESCAKRVLPRQIVNGRCPCGGKVYYEPGIEEELKYRRKKKDEEINKKKTYA